jgi:RNA polymerase sigma factor (sigma-70 family)
MELTSEHIDWAKMMARQARRQWPSVPFDDLFQEAQLRLWDVLKHYDPALNDSWQGFARKAIQQHLWRRAEQFSKWSKRNTTGHENTPDSSVSWHPDDEENAVLTQAERLISMLSDKHQYVLRQHFLFERTLEDIAGETSVSVAYIHQLHADALVAIRQVARYMGLPVCFQTETTLSQDFELSETMSDSAPQLSLFETKKG